MPPGDQPARIAAWCREHDVPAPDRKVALPVLAGPVEANALGNVLVQARANGALSGSLEDLRALVARTQEIVVHEPSGAAR